MQNGLETLSVLLVDDNAHMREIVGAVLQSLGLNDIVEAGDGRQAMALLRQKPCDVALVDFLMAPVDGVHFTRQIRTAPDSPNIYLPVIMMTGHSERTRVEEARDAGVTEFVVKPLTAKALISRINAVIHRPRPFIRCAGYFGPDRRRRADPSYDGALRRKDDPARAADIVI